MRREVKIRLIILGLVSAAIIACVTLVTIIGIENRDVENNNEPASIDKNIGEFVTIDNSRLSYDKNTKIICYYFNLGYSGYMSPFYSENGKLCKYIDGEIVEITS